jgi:UDP-2,3-diacylglucosamine hydrolase
MKKYKVRHLIHGHTHRPAIHNFHLNDSEATRIVLGDWYEQDSVLIWDEAGYRLGRIADL